jgi:hypothetical protein
MYPGGTAARKRVHGTAKACRKMASCHRLHMGATVVGWTPTARTQRGGDAGQRFVFLRDTTGSIGWSVQPASAASSADCISAAEA